MKVVYLSREEFKNESVFYDIIFGCIKSLSPVRLVKDLSKFRKISRLTLYVKEYEIEYE